MIFCVEDDKNIRELIIYALKSLGYEALGFSDAKELEENLKLYKPELFLLDIMLPDKDGLQILTELKNSTQFCDIPVIMITAKGSEFDKVVGLDQGADDYITKPFGMMEMSSRIKAVLRRCGKKSDGNESVLSYKNVVLDLQKHTITVDGNEITASFKEYELLRTLMQNAGIVLSRDTLLNKIWGYDYDGESRTVDVHIRTLRAKLGDYADIIKTVRNVGYKLEE